MFSENRWLVQTGNTAGEFRPGGGRGLTRPVVHVAHIEGANIFGQPGWYREKTRPCREELFLCLSRNIKEVKNAGFKVCPG